MFSVTKHNHTIQISCFVWNSGKYFKVFRNSTLTALHHHPLSFAMSMFLPLRCLTGLQHPAAMLSAHISNSLCRQTIKVLKVVSRNGQTFFFFFKVFIWYKILTGIGSTWSTSLSQCFFSSLTAIPFSFFLSNSTVQNFIFNDCKNPQNIRTYTEISIYHYGNNWCFKKLSEK